MNTTMPELNTYEEYNSVAEKNGIVFLGSNYFYSLPICELAQDYKINEVIYNRSIPNCCIDQISDKLNTCVMELCPKKIFVNIGDEDVKNANLDVDEFMAKYEWLLYTIHTQTNADIYIVSIISSSPLALEINRRLKTLAKETGSQYIDLGLINSSPKPNLKIFDILRFYLRNHPITFAEAMNMAIV